MSNTRINLFIIAIIIASSMLTGCVPTATPSTAAIQVSDIYGIKDNDKVTAGTTLLIYVETSGPEQLTYTWEDESGRLQSGLSSSLRYIVPNTPGQTFIRVTVSGSGDEKNKQVRFTIIAPPNSTPDIAAPPTATDTPITPTATNTDIPIPPTTSVLSKCFNAQTWTPYEPGDIETENDCWDLSPWGLSEDNNSITIHPSFLLNTGQLHGIYMPIPTNSIISFNITINKFTVIQSLSGNIGIGIISMDPTGPATSRLLYYHYIYSQDNISMQTGIDGNYANTLTNKLDFSTPQSVVMMLDGRQLVMSIDGQVIATMDVPLAKRAFWIGYSIPGSSQLDAAISNIEIH